jgi:predicted ATPase
LTDIQAGEYTLRNLKSLNVILGKNGCGKSTLLKAVDASLETDGQKAYVTPERGGILNYEANMEQNLIDRQWLTNTRRVNQFTQFRQQSVAQFRRLELTYLRARETEKAVANFDPYIDRLNVLLDNIEVRRIEPTFKIYSKPAGLELEPGAISSGESELISLGIEFLAFAEGLDQSKANYLLLDEPDVHLHPDLQARLVRFITGLAVEFGFTVIIATHSTAILGGLSRYADASVAFMRAGDKELTFEAMGAIHRRVLPVFGAHPLSNVFNEVPVLIVEGEDDERVWQQAVRSSAGALQVYPVACEGVSSMNGYEREVRHVVEAVYDDARAFSLRDRDHTVGEIDDQPPLTRMKLACRAAENLLLSTDVLRQCGISWDQVRERVSEWLEKNEGHVRYEAMKAFQDGGYDRKSADLKDLRTLLAGEILASTKSWEVLVGRAIGKYRKPVGAVEQEDQASIESFLGEKAAANLLA